MRLSTVHLAVLSCALLAGCATEGGSSGHGTARDPADHSVAREHAYTKLLEVREDGEPEIIAYLVEFDELPLGVVDERLYPVGTVLVQDVALDTVGFVTPGGEAFRFDENGVSHSVGHGTRHVAVGKILGSSPRLRFRAVGGAG